VAVKYEEPVDAANDDVEQLGEVADGSDATDEAGPTKLEKPSAKAVA
jgi:hypothetical protein